MESRGQAYTIEGIIGAIVVVSALVLGLQAVDIAPWTDDSTERETERLREQVQDVLDAANDRDALRTAATCIDGDGDAEPHPAVASGAAANDSARDTLGTLLNRTLNENNQRYNVYIDYANNATGVDVGDGRVSDVLNTTVLTDDNDVTRSSVTVTRQVPLFDSDPIYEFDADEGECVRVTAGANNTLAQRDDDPAREVYVENQNTDSDLYAVVKIRVIAW